MTRPIRYQDIFVPGGFPRHTYNPRAQLQLEDRLGELKDNLCKLVTITGQTKSGKTVLTRRVLPPEDAIWIDGGTVAEEDDFWQVINEQLDLFQTTQTSEEARSDSTIEAKAKAGASVIVAKGEGELGGRIGRSKAKGTSTSRTISARVAALKGLREMPTAVVVDDFHYLPREMQGSIVRALKPVIFDGLPVAIIAIPHRRYDALKVEKEMTGRISPIDIPTWSQDELEYIPRTGFGLLNYRLDDNVRQRLAAEAIGSPHLMQDFCRGICKQIGLLAVDEMSPLAVTEDQIEWIFRDVAETIGRPIFEKLARGPQSRTDRIQRQMAGGKRGDIYELVLTALAHMRPGLVSIEYEDLRAAVRSVSVGTPPQLQEVTRVLKHMSTIASTDQSSTPVIDFEEEEKKLHVTDPFFAFYLRWGEIVRNPGEGAG